MADYPNSIWPGLVRGALMSDPDVHSLHHDETEAELIATQTEVGVGASGSFSTVAARLDALDPDGDGTSTTWTPVWGNVTVGSGTVIARFARIGPLVHFYVQLVLAADSSVSGNITVSVPVAIFNSANQQIVASVTMADSSLSQEFSGTLDVSSASNVNVRRFIVPAGGGAGSPIQELAANATNPFTWTTSDRLEIRGLYLAA